MCRTVPSDRCQHLDKASVSYCSFLMLGYLKERFPGKQPLSVRSSSCRIPLPVPFYPCDFFPCPCCCLATWWWGNGTCLREREWYTGHMVYWTCDSFFMYWCRISVCSSSTKHTLVPRSFRAGPKILSYSVVFWIKIRGTFILIFQKNSKELE